VQSGWEYLIETGQYEELTTAQLEDYFVKYDLRPIPSTQLEMIVQIKRHNAELKKGERTRSDMWTRSNDIQ
jgi:hypothetical protein